MKKIILALTILTLAGSQVQTAKAGGWGIAAGVLGGVAAGTIIGESIARPVYVAPAPVYAAPAPPVYYAPAPAVVYPQPVYYAPAPVVTIYGGYGYGYRPHYYARYGYRPYRGRW
jgi:hypothetical protein